MSGVNNVTLMRDHFRFAVVNAGLCIIASLWGCSSQAPAPAPSAVNPPHLGPHGGQLFKAVADPDRMVKEGPDELLLEVVDDPSARVVTVYVLHPATRQPVTTLSGAIQLRAMVNNQPMVYAVVALPLESDPPGRASRFVTKQKAHLSAIRDPTTKPNLHLTVDRVAYTAQIERP